MLSRSKIILKSDIFIFKHIFVNITLNKDV